MGSIESTVDSLTLWASDRTQLRPSSMGGNRYADLTATLDPTTSGLSLALGPDAWGPVRMKDLTEAYDYEVHPGKMHALRGRLKSMELNQVIKSPEAAAVHDLLSAWGLAGSSSFDAWFEQYRRIAELRNHPLERKTEADVSAMAAWKGILELETVVEIPATAA
jgi:hypothetical protein